MIISGKDDLMKVVLTGALINKKTGKVIAVGEWEALQHFLDEMKTLNPKEFNKRDFFVKHGGVSHDTATQASIVMQLGFGKDLRIYSCPDEKSDDNL
jgi:hypothetical protein